MPRVIRYTRSIGTIVPGDMEEKSDVDATILVALGVAEETAAAPHALPAKEVEEEDDMATSKMTRNMQAEKKKKRAKKQDDVPENRRDGYRRRDMKPERRK